MHLWQMAARRAGSSIPYSLRKRVASILKCLDVQAAKGARTSAYLAYGAAFVGFLLALRYYRECRRLRQINIAQKDAFDMHVLKVKRYQLTILKGSSGEARAFFAVRTVISSLQSCCPFESQSA